MRSTSSRSWLLPTLALLCLLALLPPLLVRSWGPSSPQVAPTATGYWKFRSATASIAPCEWPWLGTTCSYSISEGSFSGQMAWSGTGWWAGQASWTWHPQGSLDILVPGERLNIDASVSTQTNDGSVGQAIYAGWEMPDKGCCGGNCCDFYSQSVPGNGSATSSGGGDVPAAPFYGSSYTMALRVLFWYGGAYERVYDWVEGPPPGSPTPTQAPSPTLTSTPTATRTATPTPTRTRQPTPTATATPAVDLSIQNVEFTQVIQCMDATHGDTGCADNSVPLVKNKTTVIRVYVQLQVLSGNLPSTPVNARLYLDAPVGSGPVQVAALNGPLVVTPGTPQRVNLNDSLNYRLPLEWTANDSLQLHVEINLDRCLTESNYANNRRDMTLTFQSRDPLTVLYLPVRYLPPGAAAPLQPTSRIHSAEYLMQRLYPLGLGDLQYLRGRTIPYNMPIASWADEQAFVRYLNLIYASAVFQSGGGAGPDQVVAWLPWVMPAGTNGYVVDLGLSDPLWYTGMGHVVFAQGSVDGAFTLAHELAHNLGRRHASTVNNADACGAFDPHSDWPYGLNNSAIQEEGLDPYANSGLGEVKVGSVKKDVMAYCSNTNAQPVNIWISPWTYTRLYAANSQASYNTVTVPTEYALVSGQLLKAGGGTLDPLLRLTSDAPAPPLPSGGAYCLQFNDGSGDMLRSVCFDATFVHPDGQPVDSDSFFFVVPFPAGTQRVVLVDSTASLATRAASANAPQISITAPVAGATWDGMQTIRWTATDADGDPLQFSLVYSRDGGTTWLPIDAEVTGNTYALDTGELPGGDQARVRVLASDGFHTTFAEVGPLLVSRKGPRPTILEPVDGTHILAGSPLLLVAGGDDLEDGSLPPMAFSWSSDRDGVLGTGMELQVAALSVGVHHITVTARDSDANTGTATITVVVSNRKVFLPLALRRCAGTTATLP